jgi:beta-phosphoglucomutase-like phosphatase (HAD superfamily)
LSALAGLGVPASQAIALEDSPNGVAAAKNAGMYCVAIPNVLTRQLTLDQADLRLSTLEEMKLESLLAKAEARQRLNI